jgi:hypothetical protein
MRMEDWHPTVGFLWLVGSVCAIFPPKLED